MILRGGVFDRPAPLRSPAAPRKLLIPVVAALLALPGGAEAPKPDGDDPVVAVVVAFRKSAAVSKP